MALPQLVVALSFLALTSGNKDTKRDTTSQHLLMNTASQNATDQQREANGETYARFLRWARHSPTEEFSSVPFSPEAMQENQQSPWGPRRSAAMLLKVDPPLDKIDGRYLTRELEEPEGADSLRGEALMTRRLALQPEFMPSHSALNQFRRKRSDLKAIPGPSDDVRLVKRLDMIDKGEWVLSGSSQRGKKGFGTSKKISGSGYDLWEKKNFDDSDEYVNTVLNKRNFDEIDRAGFHSLGRRNFDEIGRAGFHSMGRRNFDEIDRAGFHSLGKRNFDEIDRAGFHSLGRRNFDEIDRSGFYNLGRRNFDEIDRAGFHSLRRRNFDEIDRAGFHSLGRRNFDEIDKSAFRGFGKRDFDEIDKSGFRSFGKRNFDEIDRSGFRNFGKRNFDEIDRSGFRELGKRNSEHSLSFDESSKDSGEAYKVENNESEKRNFYLANKSAFRNFNKRSTTKEKSKIST